MRLSQDAGVAGAGNASLVVTYDQSCPFGIKTPECPLGSVHNVNKSVVSARAARSLLADLQPAAFPPIAPLRASTVTAAPTGRGYWLVTVAFDGTPLALRPTQYCDACCDGAVGDFDASADGVVWANGTSPTVEGGNTVVFTVAARTKPVAVRYTANQAFPQCAVVSSETGLPASPFAASVSAF